LQRANQELTLAHEKLKKSLFTTIQVFSNLIELRGGAVAGHARRVADIGRKIAEKMDLGAHEAQEVMVAGLLHDIGKIGFPDAVMSLPVSKMSGEVLGLVRKHAANGALALMPLPHLRSVAAMIRGHHERFDGQGYPDALSGLEIPVGSRILAVANDYDGAQVGALFPRKLTMAEARDHIVTGRGTRYDPTVVDAFLDLSGRSKSAQLAEREIRMSTVQTGMVLARDIISREGVMLLAADYLLDDVLVRQLHDHAENDSDVYVWVRGDK
jgi:response regulator RpfG family c-di-GMP phosphodiesterase